MRRVSKIEGFKYVENPNNVKCYVCYEVLETIHKNQTVKGY